MPGCPPPAVWSRGGPSSRVLGPLRTGGTRLYGPRAVGSSDPPGLSSPVSSGAPEWTWRGI